MDRTNVWTVLIYGEGNVWTGVNCGQVLCVDRANVWRGLMNVHQVLENTLSIADRLSEGLYTILILQHLLLVDRRFSLNTLLQSTKVPHLLMLLCDTNQLLKCLCQHATL
jgi:hypothetical protein